MSGRDERLQGQCSRQVADHQNGRGYPAVSRKLQTAG